MRSNELKKCSENVKNFLVMVEHKVIIIYRKRGKENEQRNKV